MGRRVGAVRGGLVYRYLYGAGDTVLAEKVGNEWVYYGYGGAMDQSVSGSEVAYQYWNYRGDLVSQSPAWGERVPAPITDAFGDVVNGTREPYDWNGLWGFIGIPCSSASVRKGAIPARSRV
ncbi:MAG: hypothetical protein C4337_04865 [Armatimonadota bacterium]